MKRLCTSDNSTGRSFIDIFEHMIESWSAASIISSTAGFFVPCEAAVAIVFTSVWKASGIDHAGKNFCGTNLSNTVNASEITEKLVLANNGSEMLLKFFLRRTILFYIAVQTSENEQGCKRLILMAT